MPDCNRFAFLNQLKKVDLLCIGSVSVLWVLGVSGILPAQANPPTNLVQLENGLIQQQIVGETAAPPKGAMVISREFVALPSSTPVARDSSELPPPSPSPVKTWQEQLQSGSSLNSSNPAVEQQPYLPPTQTPPENPLNSIPLPKAGGNFTPPASTPTPNQATVPLAAVGQQPYLPPTQTPLPVPSTPLPLPNAGGDSIPITPSSTQNQAAVSPTQESPLSSTKAVNSSALRLQGAYVNQADESSARGRLSAVYPLTSRALFGATLDLTDGNAFSDSRNQGLNLNELYFATSLANLPNLRFVVGQMDLTSYFDRNSFAKDGATHFFNPLFQTNPALVTTGLNSRPGLLVNWSLTDNIEAKAAVFSSSGSIGEFALDGFASEVAIRYGNAIIRGTYATDRDAGSRDGFQEIFQIGRENGKTGPLRSDREESYGVNAEVFIPNLKLGLFGRYGKYENSDLGLGGDTYSIGMNLLDLLAPDDRLGIAYGRNLSNDKLRRRTGDEQPDVLEVFYDFRFLPNLRLGFSIQERDNFSETVLGFRVKSEFDLTQFK